MAGGRFWILLVSWLAVGLSSVSVAQSATVVGAEGFPADWQPEDFEVAGEEEGAPQAREGNVARGTKPMSWNVADMPSVASVSSLATATAAAGLVTGLAAVASETVNGVSVTQVNISRDVSVGVVALPLNQVDLSVRPDVDGEDLKAEENVGGLALGRYGLAPMGVALRVGWENSNIKDLNKAWPETAGLMAPLYRGMLADVLVTPGEGAKGVEPTAWLAWRMKKLLEIGQAEAAWQLGQVVSPVARERDRSLAEAWGLVRLVAGDTAAGCAALRDEGVEGKSDDTLWRQAVMVCQALTRGREGLGLSLQLAEGDGVAQALNPLLKSLLDAIAVNGAAPVVPAGAKVGALEAALYGAYPALIRDEVWGQLPDLVLWRLVRTEALPLALRTRAAEGLVARVGSADAENALVQLYGSFSFTPQQLSAPAQAGIADAVMQRALLWQAAAVGGGKSEAAWIALDTAWRKSGMPTLARQMLAPAGLELASADGLLRELEAALWRGERGKAEALWGKLSKLDGLSTPQLRARARLGVLTLAVIGKEAGVWLDQWLAAVPLTTVGEKQRVLRQLAVWQAVGLEVSPAQQQQILIRLGDVPGAAQWPVWQELIKGVLQQGKRGEALAMAVQAAGVEPSASGAAGWVAGTLGVLRELGDAQALRRLALVSILPLPGEQENATGLGVAVSGTVTVSASAPVSGSATVLPSVGPSLRAGTLFLSMPSDEATERAPDWLLPPPRVGKPVPPVPPRAPRP